MNIKYILLPICLFFIYGCKNDSGSSGNPDYLNRSVNPLDDFYEFSCGGWLKEHPLRPGEAQRSLLGELRDSTNQQIETILQQILSEQKYNPREAETDSVVWLNEWAAQLYVQNYFSPGKKQAVQELAEKIRTTYLTEIKNVDWLTTETKQKAIEKIQHFTFNIGYPDEWDIESKIKQPIRWELLPQVVTANYNEKANEFYFPAGILQPPFYYYQGDEAWNYGAIGVVIAHEIVHALNDRGREYDEKGNPYYWWTNEDEELYSHKTQPLVEYFNSIQLGEALYANGDLTLNENFADLIGIQIAFKALLENKRDDILIDSFTPEQRFFIAYSVVKAAHISDSELETLTKTGIQSIGRWRVNAILPHVPAFHETWNQSKKTDI